MAEVCSRTWTFFLASKALTSILLPYPKDHIVLEPMFMCVKGSQATDIAQKRTLFTQMYTRQAQALAEKHILFYRYVIINAAI